MTNPWLDLPLADYEGHMAHPDVAQAPLLALESVMKQVDPGQLRTIAAHHGLHQLSCSTRDTGRGKQFQVQTFLA